MTERQPRPTHVATCLACGREFEVAGSLGTVLREAQGATAEESERLRARDAEERGGAFGICSLPCALRRVFSIFSPKN